MGLCEIATIKTKDLDAMEYKRVTHCNRCKNKIRGRIEMMCPICARPIIGEDGEKFAKCPTCKGVWSE